MPDILSTLTIERLSERGEGIARTDAGRIFVPYALAGEIVEAEVEGSRACLKRTLATSPDRIAPFCSYLRAAAAARCKRLRQRLTCDGNAIWWSKPCGGQDSHQRFQNSPTRMGRGAGARCFMSAIQAGGPPPVSCRRARTRSSKSATAPCLRPQWWAPCPPPAQSPTHFAHPPGRSTSSSP